MLLKQVAQKYFLQRVMYVFFKQTTLFTLKGKFIFMNLLCVQAEDKHYHILFNYFYNY